MLVVAIWNFVLSLPPFSHPTPPIFANAGLIAGFAFLFLAFRGFVARTWITLDEKGLDIRNAWAPWSKLSMPLADVAGFEAIFHEKGGHWNVAVRLRTGDRRALPVDWQPVPLALKGSKKAWFVAAPSTASSIAGDLQDMLFRARDLGHDTFRS